MVGFPPCKINLGLHILYKRQDGFHELETCFFPVPWTDVLEVVPANSFSFTQTGLTLDSQPDDNLCVRAWRSMNVGPVAMHLHKVIPAGAGLGGGSSDAAWALRLINQTFDNSFSHEALLVMAASLGSDCAFFVDGQPAIGRGRGEVLTPASVDLTGWHLVVICPPVHVSTREAYANVKPQPPARPLEQVLSMGVSHWRHNLVNDFEASVMSAHPELGAIKKQLYDDGATYASMSGSGSSIFALFERKPKADILGRFTGWVGQL